MKLDPDNPASQVFSPLLPLAIDRGGPWLEGPAREEKLRERFLPQKPRPHLSRTGWRQGTSVYPAPTPVADDVCWALGRISIPSHHLGTQTLITSAL